jgi:RNA polymerase sigma-70 factor (family 1)
MESSDIEQRLIRELKEGSQKAFDNIYKMYAKRLYAFCMQYTKISEDAEEIVEDVFVKLWMNKENIRQEDTLRSLLFIMSKHTLINVYRNRVNTPTYENYLETEVELSVSDTLHHIEYEEFLKQLNHALQKLPTTQQKIIKLSKLQQLSNKEIAERLSLSEQTIKNQLSLGLKSLKEELNKVSILLWLLFLINYTH